MVGHTIDIANSHKHETSEKRNKKIIQHYNTVRGEALEKAKFNGDMNEVYWEITWKIFEEVN